ncbi:MAG: DUF2239 family protein [Sphingobium sp.]|nr:DUF2239 family protein [Sphingobium sp.]
MMTNMTIFVGDKKILSGSEDEVRTALRSMGESAQAALLFDDENGKQVDIDLREDSAPTDAAQGKAAAPRGRGRPNLGVRAREVTLLPRHWEWLATQKGGASVTLRKLVEAASKQEDPGLAARQAMDASYAFSMAMAGNLPGYEGAMRALYTGDEAAFAAAISGWPADIRDHSSRLAQPAFAMPA